MSIKCNLYESLYIFRSEEELQEHIDECEICREKHSAFLQVEKLVRTAKPYHARKKALDIKLKQKILASMYVLVIFTSTYSGYAYFFDMMNPQSQPEIADLIDNSFFNRMNLPTDEYGILNPHEEMNYEPVSYEE